MSALMSEIAAWPLEAESDDIDRYFLDDGASTQLLQADARLVVGARGSGKTALARKVVSESGPDQPAIRIALGDPFLAAWRRAADSDVVRGAALGRYLIALGAFEALVSSRRLEGAAIRQSASAFALDVPAPLRAALPQAFNRSLVDEVFRDAPLRPFAEGLAELDAELARMLSWRTAVVVFDEAPDRAGVREMMDGLSVTALGHLLDAAAVHAQNRAAQVRPLVFVRRRLFDALDSARRAAWTQRRLDLVWSQDRLEALAGFRIARAASPAFEPREVQPSQMLRRMFRGAKGLMEAQNRRSGVWPFVFDRTLARPRDAVHFLKAAAQAAKSRRKDVVDKKALAEAEATHAAYLRAWFADDLRADAPEADAVLARLPSLERREAPLSAVQALIEACLVEAGADEVVADTRRVLQRLFEASVLGQVERVDAKRSRTRFRHLDADVELSFADPLAVHPGLWAQPQAVR